MSAAAGPVRVRPAVREDIPTIVAIALSSVTDEEEVGFGTPRSQQTFADVGRLSAAWTDPNRVREEEVLVAEVDGHVVGCVTLEDRDESLELVNIDVARERQGQGIGTQMVRFVEDRSRRKGKRAVTLGTSRNAAGVPWKSLPWWRHLGYRITHEEENAWTQAIGPGVREIRMRKQLVEDGPIELRPVAAADLPVFFEQQQDPVALRIAAFTAKDPSDRDAFMAHWARILQDPKVTIRTIVLGGQAVGNVGSFVDPQFGRTEVTYWIGRASWGRGIATRALSAFLAEQRIRPIYARAARDNIGSVRVLEKCGFKAIDRARGFANARGEEVEELVFELRGSGSG